MVLHLLQLRQILSRCDIIQATCLFSSLTSPSSTSATKVVIMTFPQRACPVGFVPFFLFFPYLQMLRLQVNFITILLVKLTSDGSKWPKLCFGEVLYRLEPRYNSLVTIMRVCSVSFTRWECIFLPRYGCNRSPIL